MLPKYLGNFCTKICHKERCKNHPIWSQRTLQKSPNLVTLDAAATVFGCAFVLIEQRFSKSIYLAFCWVMKPQKRAGPLRVIQ